VRLNFAGDGETSLNILRQYRYKLRHTRRLTMKLTLVDSADARATQRVRFER